MNKITLPEPVEGNVGFDKLSLRCQSYRLQDYLNYEFITQNSKLITINTGDYKMQLDEQIQQHVISLPIELKTEEYNFIERLGKYF